jgi:hypothetical protein
MYALGLGFSGPVALAAAVFAGILAFTLDMVPVAFAPVWARAGWKLMIPGFVLLLGFMVIGSALQVNAVVTYDQAQKGKQISEATDRYNTAVYTLDSILLPTRDCLCPQTRRADVVQYDAKRKAPMMDKINAEREIANLRKSDLPIAQMGIALSSPQSPCAFRPATTRHTRRPSRHASARRPPSVKPHRAAACEATAQGCTLSQQMTFDR